MNLASQKSHPMFQCSQTRNNCMRLRQCNGGDSVNEVAMSQIVTGAAYVRSIALQPWPVVLGGVHLPTLCITTTENRSKKPPQPWQEAFQHFLPICGSISVAIYSWGRSWHAQSPRACSIWTYFFLKFEGIWVSLSNCGLKLVELRSGPVGYLALVSAGVLQR